MVQPITKPVVIVHPAIHAERTPNPIDNGDSQRATAERDPFHAHQVGNRKLDADREHQQHDAKFGKDFKGVQVGDLQAGCEWADDDAAQHETEDQWKPDAPGNESTNDSGKEYIG